MSGAGPSQAANCTPSGGSEQRERGGSSVRGAGPSQAANCTPSGGSERSERGGSSVRGAGPSQAASVGKDTSAAIVVAGLTKSYGKVEAVKGISFAVRAGTTTALLGGNGAGKTTTIAMLLGVLTPTGGEVTVLGEDMHRHAHRVLPRMNFTSPYVDLPKRLKVGENLHVFADLYGVRHARDRIAEVAAEFELTGLLKRPYGELSAGQRTRVSLAKAVLNEPDLLLLDEPTAS